MLRHPKLALRNYEGWFKSSLDFDSCVTSGRSLNPSEPGLFFGWETSNDCFHFFRGYGTV